MKTKTGAAVRDTWLLPEDAVDLMTLGRVRLARRVSVVAFLAVGALFVALTYASAHVPLFRDSTTGAYGRG